MDSKFLWYNVPEQEYQIGDREMLLKVSSNFNDSRDCILLEKFVNLSERVYDKLKSRIASFNQYRRSRQFRVA